MKTALVKCNNPEQGDFERVVIMKDYRILPMLEEFLKSCYNLDDEVLKKIQYQSHFNQETQELFAGTFTCTKYYTGSFSETKSIEC